MRNIEKAIILFFALFISLSLAVCPALERSLYVPAIIDENSSEMVKISVETRAGKGETFLSVGPAVGIYTQASEKIAADVAFKITGKKDCDVILRIFAPEGVSHVDGPSAGAAMTLLMLSALEQKDLRDDFSITGTIEPNGLVGAVGGVPLKVEAVANLNKKLFLVPLLGDYEKLSTLIIQDYYDITIKEVEMIQDAYDIALSSKMPSKSIKLTAIDVPSFEISAIDHPYKGYFEKISNDMINEVRGKIADAAWEVDENFQSRLRFAEAAHDKGHFYTSANTAFLLLIDSAYAKYSDANMQKEYENLEKCLDEFEFKNLSLENFELVGGADLRYFWAKKRMPTMPANIQERSLPEKLSIYGDSLYSKNWCEAANKLYRFKLENETFFSDEIIKDVAEEVLFNATSLNLGGDEELIWHLENAMEAFKEKRYVASIIDSSYVVSGFEIVGFSNEGIDWIIESYGEKKYEYLWPQLYQDHASTYDGGSAARLYLFADAIERSFNSIESKVKVELKTLEEIQDIQKKMVEKEEKIEEVIEEDKKKTILSIIKSQLLKERTLFLMGILVIVVFISYILQLKGVKKKKGEKKVRGLIEI